MLDVTARVSLLLLLSHVTVRTYPFFLRSTYVRNAWNFLVRFESIYDALDLLSANGLLLANICFVERILGKCFNANDHEH